jgi:predicted enzyme related to lactoylglutathione lyase
MRMPHRLLLAAALLAAVATAATPAPYWPPIADPPTEVRNHGRFVWGELVTNDVGLAAEFYGATLGWTFETYGDDDDRKTYTLVLAEGRPIGGMVFHERAEEAQAARWIGLISVADAAVSARKVAQAGGKIVFGPKRLGERGEVAVFADPEGALAGMVRSASGDPEDYLGGVGEWLWVELWSDDATKAAEFYAAAFGYSAQAVEGAAGMFRLSSDGKLRAGIAQKSEAVKGAKSVWLPYLRVADVDATVKKAEAAGGRVAITARAFHGAKVAVLVDPTGAPFAVAELDGGAK